MIELDQLPAEPGCYLFRDSGGEILYIGKAKHLKKRVASYFQKRPLDPKTARLVERIASVDCMVTDTETEALILESNLIKRHQPKYNIDLKDAKSYAYIQITDEEFPRIGMARRPGGGSGTLFGPFVSAQERDFVLQVLKKTFRLRTCRRLPKKTCLRYHMQSCSAPCIGKIGKEEYRESVKRAEAVLRGRSAELLSALRAEMEACAEAEAFEKALELRGQIQAIERLGERQHVARQKKHDEDVINFVAAEGSVWVMVFAVQRGTLTDREWFRFEGGGEFLEEFVARYYADREPPSELILPQAVGESLQDYLAYRKGKAVRITVPAKGEKKRLLELVQKNIEAAFFGERIKLEALKKSLHLPVLPRVIECFDISHLSGTSTVGAMVQFREGKPDKRNYRRFRIRSVEGVDDTAAIAEVVRRRYARLQKEGGELPDLIVIDGGKGQLSAALAELKRLSLSIPAIALAKREEEIYIPALRFPLPVQKKERASLFLQEIRDEAHRVAVAYNRLLRSKKLTG
ncbi:MAG: excinuclease ABC subunit UvrC [Methanomicrobiales archaeon]|nr:excinuclease ABC subunit UvrC [Methanomicrobiales archaeon]